MSDNNDNTTDQPTIKDAFDPGKTSSSGVLFEAGECDLYVNKITLECFIFHAKPVEDNIERLEYHAADHTITVVKKDGTRLELGAKIQWLIRPYFTKAKEIGVVQTKDGEVIDGFMVPIIHTSKAS